MGLILSPRCTLSKLAPPHHGADLRPHRALAYTLACVLVMAAVLCAGLPAPARADNSPDAPLARFLDRAPAAAPAPRGGPHPGPQRLGAHLSPPSRHVRGAR